MKKRLTALIALVLIALFLTACDGTVEITVDENGVARWEPIKGAVEYEYVIVDASNTPSGEYCTTETSVQLPEGMSLHIRPIMRNGEAGSWSKSDYFGEPLMHSETAVDGELHSGEILIIVDENGVASWEPIEGALEYEYAIVDADYTNMGVYCTTETSVQLPEGMSLHMRAVM